MSRKNFTLLHLLTLLTAAFSLLNISGCTESKKNEVNLAIWSNYLTPEMQKKFTDTTGIKVNVLNYASNEELLAKIQAGGSGIDLAVPSDYMVSVMIKLGLLETMSSELAAFKTIDPELLKQSYDPKNEYSIPYAWMTTGLAYRQDLYSKEIQSWKDVLGNPELKGKFSILDDYREATAAALKIENQSVNTIDPEQLNKAKLRLKELKAQAKLFTSDSIDILKNKEVIAAHAYSSDALQAAEATGGKVKFVMPAEGATRSIDNLVILKGSPRSENARKLIEFLLQKENNAEFVKKIKASPVVLGVRELLPPELQNNEVLFPSKQKLSKLERLIDLGEQNKLYEEIWTAVKVDE